MKAYMFTFFERFEYFQNVIEWIFSKLRRHNCETSMKMY